jgi:hypothetical protein
MRAVAELRPGYATVVGAGQTKMNAIPPGPFPHVYRYARLGRYITVIVAVAFIVGVLAFWINYLISKEHLTIGQSILAIAMCAAGILLGSFMIAGASRYKVILDAEGIEIIGLFQRRRIAYEDIGAKMAVPAFWPTWAIVPTLRSKKSVVFEFAYDFDQVFKAWFADIPKADNAFWRQRRWSRN